MIKQISRCIFGSKYLLLGCSIIKFSIKKSPQQQNYHKSRIQSLQKTKSLIYPSFQPSLSIKNYHIKYKYLKTSQTFSQQIQCIGGRISSIRKHGKTIFIDIRDQHQKLQILIKNNKHQDQLEFRRGDVVGVKGIPFVTKKGELSLQIRNQQDIHLLSPCLWMLPQYNSLKDNQVRYRNKHLDLLTNPKSLQTLVTRSKIISSLRKQLQILGFIEVQTPVLSCSYGGAIAKPFQTYHNDHKMSLYMRIAPQLYLKKLIIGGFNKVFEIGKNFRNQSIDQTHNPQFTTCELYQTYTNYKQMMTFTKDLIRKIVFNVKGDYKLNVQQVINGQIQNCQIDLQQEWKVFDFLPDLQKYGNLKLPSQFESQNAREELDRLCVQHHVACDQPRTSGRLLDKLCGKYLQSQTPQPFFITNQPLILSPLSKPHPSNPSIVQRFQLFINNWQIVNSYTELNNPFIQKQNTPVEVDFIQALEYGLPPTAGWGIGIDRLVMLITGKERIQEVIAFPLLRQHKDQQETYNLSSFQHNHNSTQSNTNSNSNAQSNKNTQQNKNANTKIQPKKKKQNEKKSNHSISQELV